ncbi:MAG: rod shape-determining protein MreD [Chitinophagaceae bacterium]|nr:rod shape-determining protein MreD [Chitinophagaceae bacterium]MBL0336310.1 rod shape-determining protein MreD [Chitinophagaceae bacterium]
MSDVLRNIVRLAAFILIQVYVLNKVPHLHRFITPYIYFLFIIWLPFSVTRIGLLFVGFFTGLILDYFMMTPGLHAAACVLIAFVRPFIIGILTPKDSSEFNYREPSPRAMQWTPYAVYVLVLTLLHHGYMLFLEFLDAGTFLDFIIRVITTTGISLLLIFTVELVFPRQLKFRTNTA